MEISVFSQAAAFIGAVCLGMAVGLVYDLIRIPRACIPIPLLGGLLDFLFWIAVTAALFLYAMAAGNGEVRIFMAAALFGGATAYFIILSPWIRKLTGFIIRIVVTVWRFITFPVVWLAAFIKKLRKYLKIAFLPDTKGIK